MLLLRRVLALVLTLSLAGTQPAAGCVMPATDATHATHPDRNARVVHADHADHAAGDANVAPHTPESRGTAPHAGDDVCGAMMACAAATPAFAQPVPATATVTDFTHLAPAVEPASILLAAETPPPRTART